MCRNQARSVSRAMKSLLLIALSLAQMPTVQPHRRVKRRCQARKFIIKCAKAPKLFSLFNVVKFANDPCLATDLKNGTCYTVQECNTKQGIHGGTCAGGYGVCCTFSLGCGFNSNENNTYFQSSNSNSNGPTSGNLCLVEICPASPNICQLRLDFSTFVIAGPSTSTLTISKIVNGVESPTATGILGGTVTATGMGQCREDQFFVTNPGGPSPPVICGIMTGEHIYVDASIGCNKIGFRLGDETSTTRQWDIQITQFSCASDNLPPEGCTQYHFGSTTGSIKSFNYDGNLHLANQNQNICIRRERGICRICYSAAPNEFDISYKDAEKGYIGAQAKCCGYGTNGQMTIGYDCVIIPISTLKNTLGALIPGSSDEFCGRALASQSNNGPATICSQQIPFHVRFLSDTFEFLNEANVNPNGFRLHYEMLSCGS